VPVKLSGNGHLPSIGARFPAPECPVLPGETVAETVAVGGGLWLQNDFRYSLEATPFSQVSLSETLESLKAALADRYVLARELGRGGMATVYLARDVRHDRPVALKVLHPELAHALGPERFIREIRLAAPARPPAHPVGPRLR
jgi:hypothetical protein